jgi:mutator protein MutT
LTSEDIAAIGSGRHSLDALVRTYIHAHLSYRFVIVEGGAEARTLEALVREGALRAGAPLLNPSKGRSRSSKAPSESQPVIPVLAAVVSRNGSVLIARRPQHKRHGGLWEFPGGKIRAGETLVEAARRELNEELGMFVTSVGHILFEQQDPGSPFLIRFVEVDAEGEAAPSEHDAVAWVTPAELSQYALAPTDSAFAATLTGSR